MLRSTTRGATFFSAPFDAVVAREDLVSQDEARQLTALHHLVAYMAAGKDMSGLYTEVAALTSTTSMRIKRLTYLYLAQNSHLQSEKAVLQAGALVKDTLSASPLLRGAALRTMTRLCVLAMVDFATAPLLRCLVDGDAYVRRAAVYGVVKQYVTSSRVCAASGLLSRLPALLHDRDAAVVAAAAQALCELHARHCRAIDCSAALHRARRQLRRALHKTRGEWAMCSLLEALAHTLVHAAAARKPHNNSGSNDDDDDKKNDTDDDGSSTVDTRRTRRTASRQQHRHRRRQQARQQRHDSAPSDGNNNNNDDDDGRSGGGDAEVHSERARSTRDSDRASDVAEDGSDDDDDDVDDDAVARCALPFLFSANTAVTMAAARVVVVYLERTCAHNKNNGNDDDDGGGAATHSDDGDGVVRRQRQQQYAAAVMRALVSLVTAAPRYEMRYAVLRHVSLLLRQEPPPPTTTTTATEEDEASTRPRSSAPPPAASLAARRGHEGEAAYTLTAATAPSPSRRAGAMWRTLAQAQLSCFLILHDDPDYVKREKLNVLVGLADASNAAQVLTELLECVAQDDHALVKQSIHQLGTLATRLPSLCARCVGELERLMRSGVPHIVEHTAVVVRRILQRYHGEYVELVTALCDALTVLSDEEAKVSAVWVLGAYATHIPRVMHDYLELFCAEWDAQPVLVQLAVVTALAKIVTYTRLGVAAAVTVATDNSGNGGSGSSLTTKDAHDALQQLQRVAQTSEEHDVRDRAVFYVRLLTTANVDKDVLRGIVDVDTQDDGARHDGNIDDDGSGSNAVTRLRDTMTAMSPARSPARARQGQQQQPPTTTRTTEAATTAAAPMPLSARSLQTRCFDQLAVLLMRTPDTDALDAATAGVMFSCGASEDGDDGNNNKDEYKVRGEVTAASSSNSGSDEAEGVALSRNNESGAAARHADVAAQADGKEEHDHVTRTHDAAAVHADDDRYGTTQAALAPRAPAHERERDNRAYTTVLHATAASGVEVAMLWSQQGTQLILRATVQLRRGDDYVHSTRVTDMQVNRNAFGLGVAHAFAPVTLARDDAAAVHIALYMSSNHATRPTRDIEVAMAIEFVGVRYFVAPPVPPALLLLPATGCSTTHYVQLLRTLPQPAWQLPPQLTPLHIAPHSLAANTLRVHGLNLVHQQVVTRDNGSSSSSGSDAARATASDTPTAYCLYAETIARQRLLVYVLTQADTIAAMSVRCAYAPVAAYFGDYVARCIQTNV